MMDRSTNRPAGRGDLGHYPDESVSEADDDGARITVLKSTDVRKIDAVYAQGTGARPYEEPPLDFDRLLTAVERSGALRPNLDAYEVNIDARGHRFAATLDPTAPTAGRDVEQYLLVERLLRAVDRSTVAVPTEDQVAERLEAYRRDVAIDRARAAAFFDECCPDGGFTGLRRATRRDLEALGNAYWEVLRGQDGLPRTLIRVQARTMRIVKRDLEEQDVWEWRRETPITRPKRARARRVFKRFVQVDIAFVAKVWFKELGDPRTMSRATGRFYATPADLLTAEGEKAAAATEVLHFEIPSGLSIYGLPRWIGELPGVLGSRELDEVNLDFFTANAVPALAILVAGGRFSQGQQERLKEFFEAEVRGRRSVHKAIILEAESSRRAGAQGPTPNPKIDFVPLRDAQATDGLFQGYDQRNIEKIAASFRHPLSVATGKQPTIEEMRFVEEQVYQPERDAFDSLMTRQILLELGVHFVAFKTQAALIRDPEVLGKLAILAADKGVLTPDESRQALESVFDFNFPVLDTAWSRQPIPLSIASLGVAGSPAEAVREQGRQGDGTPTVASELLSDLGLVPVQPAGASAETRTNATVRGRSLRPLRGLASGDVGES